MQHQNPEYNCPLTDEIRLSIKQAILDTGTHVSRLFRKRAGAPKGFNAEYVVSIIEGKRKTYRKDYLGYILSVCEQHKAQSIVIKQADSFRRRILKEVIRTGIGFEIVYGRMQGNDQTLDFTLPIFKSWMGGRLEKICPEKITPVIEYYISLPGDSLENPVCIEKEHLRTGYRDLRREDLRDITDYELKLIHFYKNEYKLLPTRIFNLVEKPHPHGLKSHIVQSWLHGKTKQADPALLHWVLMRCQEFEKI